MAEDVHGGRSVPNADQQLGWKEREGGGEGDPKERKARTSTLMATRWLDHVNRRYSLFLHTRGFTATDLLLRRIGSSLARLSPLFNYYHDP